MNILDNKHLDEWVSVEMFIKYNLRKQKRKRKQVSHNLLYLHPSKNKKGITYY